MILTFAPGKLLFGKLLDCSTRPMFASLFCMMIAGCDSGLGTQSLIDAGNTSTLALSAPPFLLQNRTIDSADLILEVLVNDIAIEMQRQDDEWTGTVLVPGGEIARIELTWLENFRPGTDPLKLATYSNTVGPVDSTIDLPLTTSDYVSAEYDDDRDGFSNLEERINGTDPLSNLDPEITSPVSTTPDSSTPDSNSLDDSASIDVDIPRIAPGDAPTLDGLYDGIWDSGASADRDDVPLAIDNLILGNDDKRSDGQTEYHWLALHDATYLYVFVFGEFTEGATLFADSSDGQMYKDDAAELLIDGDNSKNSSFDGINDYDFLVPHLKFKQPLEANNSKDVDGRILRGANSLPLPDGFEFASCLCDAGQFGWEFRVNLEQFGIVVGRPFGIEVQISDDQDGGSRDAKWGWKNPSKPSEDGSSDDTWRNPGLMGTALLR